MSSDTSGDPLRQKFRGIHAVALRLDAATYSERNTFTTETGALIAGPGSLALQQVANLSYSGRFLPLPKSVRVTWRDAGAEYDNGRWTGGNIVGDYTVPVAERIPDELLDYIRKNGGALRLKIRLKKNGVLIGWDVEERYTTQFGKGLRYVMWGGDFREAQIFNGKIIDPGWQN